MASVMATLSTQDVIAAAVARMLLSSERHASEAQGTWTPGICTASYAATSAEGRFSVTPLGNSFGGGGGARTFTDGIDSGGVLHSMASRIPNTETVESRSPVLQLFRREMLDGGGAGRFRGGAGVEYLCTPYKTSGPAILNTLASGVSIPGGHGLSGGLPGAAVSNVVLKDSNVAELLSSGHIPLSAAELTARATEVQEAKQLTRLEIGDVLIGAVGSGAGYGDPLRRDPDAVLGDVAAGLVSEDMAGSVYAVVISEGRVDEAATAEARLARRRERVGAEPAPWREHPAEGELLHPVLDTVEAVRVDGERRLRCTLCGHALGAYGADLGEAAVVREVALETATSRNRLCSDEYVLRRLSCPGCGVAMLVEVAPASDGAHRAAPYA
jgi:N-methylhydantoinase B